MELEYFLVNGGYGWSQDWFPDFWMRLGGCAAVTACDSCIFLKKYLGYDTLYPYSTDTVETRDYLRFVSKMKPYLGPRKGGVDTLGLYIEGLGGYFRDVGENRLGIKGLEGSRPLREAKDSLVQQLELGFPVPFLMLRNKSVSLRDYVWHWFMLTGFEEPGGTCMAKAVTYGSWRWLPLKELWETGYQRKGGMIIFTRQ